MKRVNVWTLERAHRAVYCAQRDLLVRLYITGVLDYDTVAALVLSVREELDLQLSAVPAPPGQRAGGTG
jgi:hypothetical protein